MMNKDEAVQKIATAGRLSIAHAEDLYDSFFPKPVVPQYVADWYEDHKEELNESIWEYLVNWDEVVQNDFKRWMYKAYENGAITTLVNMHQFGYEVEEEIKYRVKLKGISEINRYLNQEDGEEFLFADSKETEDFRTKFTRKELEANGFGWVFSCPGVEVKEVADE